MEVLAGTLIIVLFIFVVSIFLCRSVTVRTPVKVGLIFFLAHLFVVSMLSLVIYFTIKKDADSAMIFFLPMIADYQSLLYICPL